MKQKTYFIKILIIFIFLIGIANFCYANVIELKTVGEFKSGTESHIRVEINFQEINEGIYFLQGQLDYDSDIFERIKEEDITLLNSWHDLVFNSENGNFIVENDGNYDDKSEEVMDIKLKTKKTKRTLTQITLRSLKEIGKNEVEKDIPNSSVKIQILHDKVNDESLANQILPSTGLIFPLIFLLVLALLIGLGIVQYKKIKSKDNGDNTDK